MKVILIRVKRIEINKRRNNLDFLFNQVEEVYERQIDEKKISRCIRNTPNEFNKLYEN